MSIYISEIFGPTIQGEGQLIGKPTVFVRVGGCDFRCAWCDTKYAVSPKYRSDWTKMSAEEILTAVKKLTDNKPILITLSGGNPAIYDLSELLTLGQAEGFTFSMETQGSVSQSYFSNLDYLTVSPKPPSAKMPFDPIKLDNALSAHPAPSLKIVVANKRDYLFAKRIHKKYPDIPMTLQPCNLDSKETSTTDIDALNTQLKWIIDKTRQEAWYNVSILPQLHVLIWNNERGV